MPSFSKERINWKLLGIIIAIIVVIAVGVFCLVNLNKQPRTEKNSEIKLPIGYTLDNYTVEKVLDVSCIKNSDCVTPGEYAALSRCPMATLCLNTKCTVVCPSYLGFQADETIDWKTYTNEEGEYLFKYPKEWNTVTNKYNFKNVLFGPGATNESGYGGVEYIGTLLPSQSLQDFVKKFNKGIEAGSISETAAIINKQSVVISILPKAAVEPIEVKSVSFEIGGKVFNAYLMYKTNFTKYQEDKQRLAIFNQLIITFKFLD
ncbi:MAG: hypothetical protein WCX12_01585 [Candidatus Paceibacterota bacterium]